MTTDNNQIKNTTWQDIEPLILDEKYKEFFKNLDIKTFELVLDENSRPKVVESVLKMLGERDPQNATMENAEITVAYMRETALKFRSKRILKELSLKYPNTSVYDLDGRGLHFLSEVEPVSEHSEYDKAVEVIIDSKPHKHLKMTQHYTIITGSMELHIGDKVVILKNGDKYTIDPNQIHWAKSNGECWVEIYSTPGWTKEDHILVDL